MKERQNYLFVVNPVAGGADKSDMVDRLEEIDWVRPPSILWTEPDTHRYIKAEVERGVYDAVVAVGGDGTVHMVAEALTGTGIPLGIIPYGSGNGLAKDLGIPLDIDEALGLIVEGQAHLLDAILFNGKQSFHICDAGLNAHVVMQYALSKQRTLRAYAWQLLRFYFSAGAAELQLYIDNAPVYEGMAYMAALCNGQRFGSDLIINPTGKPDDGVMEVVILKAFPKSAGPGILLDLMAGELNEAYFSTYKAKTCRFETDTLWPWQSDGEYAGQATSYNAHILPGALQVLR